MIPVRIELLSILDWNDYGGSSSYGREQHHHHDGQGKRAMMSKQSPRTLISRRSTLQVGASAVLSSLSSAAWLRDARADETGTLTVALSNNPVTCDPINMSSHDTEIKHVCG